MIHIIREDPRERNAYICAFFCQYKECDFKGVPIDAGVRVVNGIDIIVWETRQRKSGFLIYLQEGVRNEVYYVYQSFNVVYSA